MQVTTSPKKKDIAPPTDKEVCVLRKGGRVYLVFAVPGPHPQYLFVGGVGNTYLPTEAWSRHVNSTYEHMGTFQQDDMEVTFNA